MFTSSLARSLRSKVLGIVSQMACVQVYKPDRLNDLMADSDYVVMALPYTPSTHHFVNAAAINSMRPNGVLINVGRGKTLEEAALIKGMTSTGHLLLGVCLKHSLCDHMYSRKGARKCALTLFTIIKRNGEESTKAMQCKDSQQADMFAEPVFEWPAGMQKQKHTCRRQ